MLMTDNHLPGFWCRHLSLKSCGFPAIRLQQGRSGGASQAAFPKPDGVGELLN